MIKSIKTIIFLVLMPGLIIANAQEMAFLKEKLIVTPKQQAGNKANIAKKILPAITLPILFDLCCFKGVRSLINWICPKMKIDFAQNAHAQGEIERFKITIQNMLDVGPSFCPGLRSLIIYYIIHKIIVSRAEKAHFIEFIKEWEFNKNYTPKELHYSFELLHAAQKQGQPLDSKKVNELRARIKKLIQNKPSVKEQS